LKVPVEPAALPVIEPVSIDWPQDMAADANCS
jgi:hypothetical protein